MSITFFFFLIVLGLYGTSSLSLLGLQWKRNSNGDPNTGVNESTVQEKLVEPPQFTPAVSPTSNFIPDKCLTDTLFTELKSELKIWITKAKTSLAIYYAPNYYMLKDTTLI